MRIKRIIYLLLVVLSLSANVYGQADCPLAADVLINDEDTTVVSVIIEGAQNNSLSTNGVCGVRLNFSHDYLADLSAFLISPSGQEIQLIGPSVDQASITQFINWDVTFIPCSAPAAPDPGLFPIWDNEGNWFQFNDYTGTYYPNLGCLEDLNTGPVNGTWSIRIEDPVRFGSGILREAEILFCDDSGIDCETCVANAGVFPITQIGDCEGKDELRFIPDIEYPTPQPDTALYTYQYLIFDVNGYVDIQDTVDLTQFQPATYTICGLSIENNQVNDLSVSFGMDKNDVEQSILSAALCADLTDECMVYEVIDVIDTLVLQESTCEGTPFIINGESYFDAGSYIVGYNGNNCDTMTILELSVFSISAEIQGGNQILSCANPRLSLDGSNSSATESFQYSWRTDDGLIRTDPAEPRIVISQTGTYYLDIISGDCIATDTVEIFDDGSSVEIDLVYDTLSCIDLTTNVTISTSVPITNIRWDGPSAFSRMGDNIVVSEPGDYTVTVTASNGCIALDTARIIGDRDVEDPIFNAQDITCINPVGSANMFLNDSMNVTYDWMGPNGFTSDLQDPGFTESGFYTVEIRGGNGCSESSSVAINDRRSFAQLTISADTLTCAATSIPINVNTSISNVTYAWEGPNSFTSDQANPSVNAPGLYSVTVTTTEQCESLIDINVGQNINPPMVMGGGITINCADNGSVNLSVSTDANSPTFRWSGPGNYAGIGANPAASVIGNYRVTVTDDNGCTDQALVILNAGNDVPNASFSSDTIDCDQPMVSIIPFDTVQFTYRYRDRDNVVFNEATPEVGKEGLYFVRVTAGNGCFTDYVHELFIDTIRPVLTLSTEEIDCDSDSVSLEFISDIPIRQGLWEGPTMFSTNVNEPFVDFPGKFVFSAIAFNGCETRDSVDVRENFDIPIITATTQVFDCNEDSIQVSVMVNMPTNSFSWEGPNGFSSINSMPTIGTDGLYKVTVTGSNGCINNDSLTVIYDTIPAVIDLIVDTSLTCPDPEVTLTLTANESGVNSIYISPNNDTLIGPISDVSEPGIWKAIAIDANNCETIDSIEVISEIIYPSIRTTFDSINCVQNTSSVMITMDDLVDSIVWMGPIPIAKNTMEFTTQEAGIYAYTAFANNGCDTTFSFEILIDTITPDFRLTFSDTLSCTNDEVTIDAIDDEELGTYEWYNSTGLLSTDSSIIISSGGSYLLRGIGRNGCVFVDTISIPTDTISPLVQGIGDTLTCRSGKITIDLITNIDNPIVSWQGPNNFTAITRETLVNEPGLYSVAVTGSNGCIGNGEAEVIEDRVAPRLFLDSISYLLCDSTGRNLEVSSDLVETTFAWFGPNQFFSAEQRPFVDQEGTFLIFARARNGCLTEDSTMVIIDTRLPQFSISAQTINCVRDSAEIISDFVNDDNSWQWTGPNSFSSTDDRFKVTEPGRYFLNVTGQNRCTDTTSIEVLRDVQLPIAQINNNEIIQCTNRRITLEGIQSQGAHNLQYFWSTSDGTIVNGSNQENVLIEDPGLYRLLVVDIINGCTDSTEILVSETAQEFLDFGFDTVDPTCEGFENGEITVGDFVGGYGPYLISFEGLSFARKEAVSFLSEGTYTVTIRDSLGCEISKEVVINAPREVSLTLEQDTEIRLGDSVRLVGNASIPIEDIALFNWSPSEDLECTDCLDQVVKPLTTTLYTLEITDVNGCTAESQVLIRVEELPDIQLPNIFNPQGDIGNQVFYFPQTKGIEIVNYMSVYDRWGNRMFHAADFAPGNKEISWNGEFQGQKVRPAVFAVIAEVVLLNGQTVIIKSDLTLIR